MSNKIFKHSNLNSSLNKLLWVLFVLFFCFGIFINYNYSAYLGSLRYAVSLLCVVFSLSILFFTNEGRRLSFFLRDARLELAKVVWPTKPEIFQSVMAVLLMVLFFGLLVWIVDGFLFWVVGLLANQYN